MKAALTTDNVFLNWDQVSEREKDILSRELDNYNYARDTRPFIFYIIDQDMLSDNANLTNYAIRAGVAFAKVYHGYYSPLTYSDNHDACNQRIRTFVRECAELVALVNKYPKTVGDQKRMEVLLADRREEERLFPDIRNIQGETLLHIAAKNNDLISFSVLIQAGANIYLTGGAKNYDVWAQAYYSRFVRSSYNRFLKYALVMRQASEGHYEHVQELNFRRKSISFNKVARSHVFSSIYIMIVILSNHLLFFNQKALGDNLTQWLSFSLTTVFTLMSTYTAYKGLEKKANRLNLIEGAFGLDRSLQTQLPYKMSRFSVTSIQALFILGYFLLTLYMAYYAQEDVIDPVMICKRKLVTIDAIGFLISIFPLIISAFLYVRLARVRESVLSPTYHVKIGASNYLFSEQDQYDSFFAALELDNQKLLSYFSKDINLDYMRQWIAAVFAVNLNALVNRLYDSNITERLRIAHELFHVHKNEESAFIAMRAILLDHPNLLSVTFEQVAACGDNLLNSLMPIVNDLKKQSVSLWSTNAKAPLTLNQSYHRQLDAIHILEKNNRYIRLSHPFHNALPNNLVARPRGEGVRLWATMSHHQKRFYLEGEKIKSSCC